MKKFVIRTKSESGDDYMYLITHPKELTGDDLGRFLDEHANDKDGEDEGDSVYEHVQEIKEIKDSEFLTIPNN